MNLSCCLWRAMGNCCCVAREDRHCLHLCSTMCLSVLMWLKVWYDLSYSLVHKFNMTMIPFLYQSITNIKRLWENFGTFCLSCWCHLQTFVVLWDSHHTLHQKWAVWIRSNDGCKRYYLSPALHAGLKKITFISHNFYLYHIAD